MFKPNQITMIRCHKSACLYYKCIGDWKTILQNEGLGAMLLLDLLPSQFSSFISSFLQSKEDLEVRIPPS